jgi:hypothetical protein
MFPGFSFKSSQYGLALDNVAGYELDLPNGTIKQVTQMDKDLWFGVSRKPRPKLATLMIFNLWDSGRA